MKKSKCSINVLVTGISGVGKSTVASVIERALKDVGFVVTNDDCTAMEMIENRHFGKNLDTKIKSLVNTDGYGEVSITVKNVKR